MTLGHYIVVVMEKLVLRQLTKYDLNKADIQEKINRIAYELQKKNYVHGDLRDANVLFDTENNRVVVVDFDWSGIDGESVYPPFMNPEIIWPDGASTGQIMCHQHDVYWLSQLCDIINPTIS